MLCYCSVTIFICIHFQGVLKQTLFQNHMKVNDIVAGNEDRKKKEKLQYLIAKT